MLIQQFRDTVYQKITRRPAATLDLLDALSGAGHVTSPVALSEAEPFRRQFSSVYDVLTEGRLPTEALPQVLYDHQPSDCETIGGYEVYALDATRNDRSDAETAPERGYLKSQSQEVASLGYKFSWLVRLVEERTSWVAPLDVQRIALDSSDAKTGIEQVKRLDGCSPRPKAVVGDSLYASVVFLAVLLVTTTIAVLVRLRHNQVLYEAPPPRLKGQKGAPRKHGAKFKLAAPVREPDECQTTTLLGQGLRLRAWDKLHLDALPSLVGRVVCVEFLRADGTPRYRYPLWLLWTGTTQVAMAELARMYLWRFAIEHAFRFLKQHLGLNANRSTNLTSIEAWMWLCGLAYTQLLLLRAEVVDCRPAWQRRASSAQPHRLTPGQVQRDAWRVLRTLGSPAPLPRSAGKGHGRAKGFSPPPKVRYEVVRKTPTRAKRAKKQAA